MPARWDRDTFFRSPPHKAGPAPGLDPYVRWLYASRGRGLAAWLGFDLNNPKAAFPALRVLASIEDAARWPEVTGHLPKGMTITTVYGQDVPGSRGVRARHFTASVTSQEALDWLIENPLALRWKAALPLRNAQQAAQASPKGRFGPMRDAADMQATNLAAEALGNFVADHPVRHRGVMAVIDFGCPFLHERFATPAGTRLVALWDQGQGPERTPGKHTPDWPWHRTAAFAHGRELGPSALQTLCSFARSPGAPDEALIYRGLDHLIAYADPRRRVWYATHGGVVLDLAAGWPTVHGKPAPGSDAAGRANLVFVELPSLTAADSAGASLGAHVLDGVRYAMACADPEHPLVAVLSYGNTAGPHDGTSLIEEALEELLELRPKNFALVLAAGNARADGGHVRRPVAKGRSALLRFEVAPGDTTDTFVEIWYPREGPELQLRARSPGLVWSGWVGQGEELLMRSEERSGEFVAMIRHDKTVPNSTRQAMALLALGPTAQPRDVPGPLAESGAWEIELRLAPGSAAGPVVFDAWIERDDPARGSGAMRTRFVDLDERDECNTLNGMATGGRPYKAGVLNCESGTPAPYSSLPADLNLVDPRFVLVACEEDLLQPSATAAATRSGEVFRMNGTSVAAPLLARQLYNAMSDPKRPRKVPGKGRVADPIEQVLRERGDLVQRFRGN